MFNEKTQEFVRKHGEWTAMAIRLPDGTHTRAPAADFRLRRLLQSARDTIGKPLSQCRVLDLACLEGHYAIEFALHGAQAVGVEARQTSLDKCNNAKEQLGLENVSFVKDDVRNLSAAKYGMFDIVVCSGILYHLPAADAVAFLEKMAQVCTGILLVDTFVSLSGRTSVTVGPRTILGHYYFEHHDEDDARTREEALWSSIDNTTSFWLTEASLANALMDCGFTSVVDVLAPTMPGNPRDRKTYLACRGISVDVLSSEGTRTAPAGRIPEGINSAFHSSQSEPSWLLKTMKRVLPSGTKDAIKPLLRALRILAPDTTPAFMKRPRI